MAQPYVGEIRMFAGNFAPAGWMTCEGQQLPISENEVLFTLIGTTYGGDGQSTFDLPNLASRLPIHMGTGPGGTTFQIGEMAGTEQETLTTQQMPAHTHQARCHSGGTNNSANPQDSVWNISDISQYSSVTNSGTAAMSAQAVAGQGGSQPHENIQPFLCINFIISLFGVFPSQT